MSKSTTDSSATRPRLDWDSLVERMRSVRALALDVDGVLTDDTIYFGAHGLELKRFHVSDGFYMALALRAGLELIVVSGRPSEATSTRMRELGVRHVLQAPINKAELIKPTLEKLSLDYKDIAFIGNEILDLPLLRVVGLPIAVFDSSPETFVEVDYITKAKGGTGAVREVIAAYFEGHDFDPEELLKEKDQKK